MKRIEWWRPVMGQREKDLISRAIDSNFPNDGPLTTEFERRIAAELDVPYAVATTSGTAAIFLGLAACGVGPGDEVLVPDVTFIATANAVRLAGATPVLVDVDPNHLCVTAHTIGAAITPRTRAIVPVHVSGRSAPMADILDVAQRHGLRVIEDAAEALTSSDGDRALGTIGDVGCFSFTANKTITTGQGGMAVTRSAGIHQRLRELKDQGRPVRGTGGADTHVSIGFNFKFTDIQAAMGLAQLEGLQWRTDHLKRVYSIYRDGLAGTPRLTLPGFNDCSGECPQWVDLLVDDRDGLHDFLLVRGIETRKFWFPLHQQAPYRRPDDAFPMSTRVGAHALWLPTSYSLTPEDVEHVCRQVNEWARQTPATPSPTAAAPGEARSAHPNVAGLN